MPRGRSAPAPARSASSAASRPRPAASSPAPPAPSHNGSTQQQAPPASSGGWFSRPAASSPPPMAAPASAAPPAMASGGGGGIMSGLIGTVVQGAALGTGSAIAHRAVDSMMGPRTVVHDHQGAPPAPAAAAAPMMAQAPPAEGPCGGQTKAFAECMSKYNGDMGACQWYFDSMQQCRANGAV